MADKTQVLVLAADPMVAALVGMLLDGKRYEAAFPQSGERAEDAMQRLRPPLVVMLDGALDDARSDLFYARAERQRALVVLFGPSTQLPAIQALAIARDIPCFTLPTDRPTLTRVLDTVISSASHGRWLALLCAACTAMSMLAVQSIARAML